MVCGVAFLIRVWIHGVEYLREGLLVLLMLIHLDVVQAMLYGHGAVSQLK